MIFTLRNTTWETRSEATRSDSRVVGRFSAISPLTNLSRNDLDTATGLRPKRLLYHFDQVFTRHGQKKLAVLKFALIQKINFRPSWRRNFPKSWTLGRNGTVLWILIYVLPEGLPKIFTSMTENMPVYLVPHCGKTFVCYSPEQKESWEWWWYDLNSSKGTDISTSLRSGEYPILYNFKWFVTPMWLWHAWRNFCFVTLPESLWQAEIFVRSGDFAAKS